MLQLSSSVVPMAKHSTDYTLSLRKGFKSFVFITCIIKIETISARHWPITTNLYIYIYTMKHLSTLLN